MHVKIYQSRVCMRNSHEFKLAQVFMNLEQQRRLDVQSNSFKKLTSTELKMSVIN